jgi:Icc-related predicted phosphoesterase
MNSDFIGKREAPWRGAGPQARRGVKMDRKTGEDMNVEYQYLVGKLQEALATDPRVNALDVKVIICGDKVHLTGEVHTEERREAVAEVVAEILPGAEVRNELTVCELSQAFPPEVIIEIPVVAVLGNHDYHAHQHDQVRRELEQVGVAVLEGESVTFNLNGRTLGIAGTKGFGGGFAGACGHAFGEPEMKEFIYVTERMALRLEENLRALQTDYRIALLHYAPVKETLAGERLEIYPFLGSYLLAEAPIPVRNVALPLIKRPYVIYELQGAPQSAPESHLVGEQSVSPISASPG